jgi:hypothetical protein
VATTASARSSMIRRGSGAWASLTRSPSSATFA